MRAKRLPTLLLAITLATPVFADEADAGILYDCPQTEERAVEVDGGYFLPAARADRLKCLLTATQAHRDLLAKQNEELKAEPGSPGWRAWVVGAVVFLAGGFVLGRALK